LKCRSQSLFRAVTRTSSGHRSDLAENATVSKGPSASRRSLSVRIGGSKPKVGFSIFGLLKGPTIGPLCDGLPRFLQALTKFLQNPLQGDLDEATRQQVRVAFEEYTVILDNSNLMPLSSLDGQKIDAHPQIFNHPTIEVCNIYRVSEVKDWLLARSDSANADSLEFKLLCYCVFKTVQNLCHRAYAAEMLFRYK
jgi:hypothetical protein